ncbi:MAG TPA: hypothetical protein VMR45_01290 [Patescibacteria group bacterium]|nr:hypothetical protein [Patescibacteria group bacterium]
MAEQLTTAAHGSLAETGPTDRYQANFEAQQASIERRRAMLEASMGSLRERAEQFRQAYLKKRNEEPDNGTFNGSVIAAEAGLVELQHQLEFLRPSSDQDMEYRTRIERELTPAIQAAMPAGLPLRFHGSTVYEGRDIIISGGLSSSVDRMSIQSSMDVAGQVSVTIPESVDQTIHGYIDLFDDKCCLPPGCIFVLLPESEEDAAAGHSMLMGNVDFQKDPRRLFAILTSHESLPHFQEWATLAGVDPQKVTEYFDFPDRLSHLGEQINAGTVVLQDLVPYPLPQS